MRLKETSPPSLIPVKNEGASPPSKSGVSHPLWSLAPYSLGFMQSTLSLIYYVFLVYKGLHFLVLNPETKGDEIDRFWNVK